MIRSRINLDDLVQTDKGTPIMFKPDDVVDKLLILGCKGKLWVPSRGVFEPIYEVQCECGNIELRRHIYLYRTDTSVNGKCCYDCANKNSGKPVNAVRKGRPRKEREEHEVTNIEDIYINVIKNIFAMPIQETMSYVYKS